MTYAISCVKILVKEKVKIYICKTYNKRGAGLNNLTFVFGGLCYIEGGNTTSQHLQYFFM